ncbi:LURP-one-related/scramblase family protein [Vagococcus entomophilus]|nr:LURP-one-related family protein [Vagococcus entomophilus]
MLGEKNMKYYIKQKVFSVREKMTVKNEQGEDVFAVEGSFLRIPKKFKLVHIRTGNVVSEIYHKPFSWFGKYEIQDAKNHRCTLVGRFSLFRKKLEIAGLNWSIVGDLMDHRYDITSPQGVIMSLNKKWFSWGDSYELSISNEEDVLLAISVAIAIDYELEKRRSRNSSSSN